LAHRGGAVTPDRSLDMRGAKALAERRPPNDRFAKIVGVMADDEDQAFVSATIKLFLPKSATSPTRPTPHARTDARERVAE
jgi:hypothetical protein